MHHKFFIVYNKTYDHDQFMTINLEAATRGILWKKVFLGISQNAQENTCARVFSYGFCKISKNTIFTEHL